MIEAIFATDGSALKKPNGKYWSAGGFVARVYDYPDINNPTERNELKRTEYALAIDNGTNNIGELTGLKYAVDCAIDLQEACTADIFFVFLLDSEYTIKSVTKWCVKWHREAKNHGGVPTTASGTPVKNYEIIWDIHEKLKKLKHKAVFKVRSHIENNELALKKGWHEFCSVNEYELSYNTWLEFRQMNEEVDALVNGKCNALKDGRLSSEEMENVEE